MTCAALQRQGALVTIQRCHGIASTTASPKSMSDEKDGHSLSEASAQTQHVHCSCNLLGKNMEEGSPTALLSIRAACLSKSKRGGLNPRIFRENQGKSALENRAFSGLVGAFPGPFRGRWGSIPPHLTATGEEQKLPRKGLFGPIGAFRAKPLFAMPLLRFPRLVLSD